VQPRVVLAETPPATGARGPSRRHILVALLGFCAVWQPVLLHCVAKTQGVVADDLDLLAPSSEARLGRLLGRLEAETGIKVRVACPPRGVQEDRERWKEYYRPLSKAWGTDESSLVIVVNQPDPRRTERSIEPKQIELLTIVPGVKLKEKFQYTLTSDYILRTASRFGDRSYVEKNGMDTAITEATENVVAALYSLLDRRQDGAKVRIVRGFREPLSPEEVTAVLDRHGGRGTD